MSDQTPAEPLGVEEGGQAGELSLELPWERRNWVLCILFWIAATALCITQLVLHWEAPDLTGSIPNLGLLFFHAAAGLFMSGILILLFLDKDPSTINYSVKGQPQFPMVSCNFIGIGRWVMFTVWSNTLCALFFDLAAISDVIVLSGSPQPRSLGIALAVLWDIVFPMSFLVNSMVSFVLYPEYAKDPERVFNLLNFRGEAMHNGFVLLTSLDAVFTGIVTELGNFTIVALYGCSYVLFAWINYRRTGIYAYFFLDPRFKYAPVAVFGLLGLLIVLFLTAGFALKAGQNRLWVRLLIFLAAVATCTWRHPRKAERGDKVTGVSSFKMVMLCLTGKS